ncbi:MAG: aminopeptidase, partial [Nevskia sp.]
MSIAFLRAAGAALTLGVSTMLNPVLAGEVVDPHSHANSNEVRSTHLALDLDVDFATSRLKGRVEIRFERLKADADRLVLDSRALDVQAAEASVDGKVWTATRFVLGDNDAVLGQALTVT